MPNYGVAEIYFISAMMILILIISAAAVFFFFRQLKREKAHRKAHDAKQSERTETENTQK